MFLQPTNQPRIVTVTLNNGTHVRGELKEIYMLRRKDGMHIQWYVLYNDGINGYRVRVVDPVTRRRWPGNTSNGRVNYKVAE